MNDTPTPATITQPTTPDELLARLGELGLKTRTVTHPPVFTVEEAKALRGELPGAHIKNLFLRDKKGKMWLVVAEEDRPIDLKALGELLGGRLSFGSADRLMTYLGVIPGAVTPFGIINDAGNQVQVIIDRELLDHDPINCHPLCNDRTTAISPQDLMAFFAACNHKPEVVDLSRVAPKA
jgi:Ala-tRNA(Pro) deacylase